jgi:hypothetical protein
VAQGIANNIEIHYNTNGTQWPEQAEDIWKHFKLVEIAFSIDDVEQRFEYQRSNARWDTVCENIDKFRQLRARYSNIRLQVCCTVNVFNVYYLETVADWIMKQQFDFIYWNMLHDAYYFSNNNYVEITNTLMVESDQSKKKKDTFTNGVKLNMLIQYYAKDNKLKALKRFYALSRMEKNINLTLLLHDFTQRSLVGKYNHVINDLKVFMYILENYSNTFALNPDINRMIRLGRHIISIQSLVQKMYNPYDKYLTTISKFIDEEIYRTKVIRYGEPSAVKNALDYCNKIIDYFSEKIDKACTEFIKVNNIDFEKYL